MNNENEILKDVLIIGCGDIGLRVARLVQQANGRVAGLARSEMSAERLSAFGVDPVMGSLDDPDSLSALSLSGRLVFFFAPPPGGGPFDSRMRNFCQAVGSGPLPEKVIYMSTSGVYGDCGGEWVTEETPINPQTSRAQRRADAETVLLEWGREQGGPGVGLRVTGM